MYHIIYTYIIDKKTGEAKIQYIDIAKNKEQKDVLKRYYKTYNDNIFSRVISGYDVSYYEYLIKNEKKTSIY